MKVNNFILISNMDQSDKIENLRLSFLKLQALGVFNYEDRHLTIEKLINKLYVKREDIEKQFSSSNDSNFRNGMSEKS